MTDRIRVTEEQLIEAPQSKLVLDKQFVLRLEPGLDLPPVRNVTRAVAGGEAVTVTNFLLGQEGQELRVLGDGLTTVQHGDRIKTNTGADKLLEEFKVYTFTCFKILGKLVWIESEGGGGGAGPPGDSHVPSPVGQPDGKMLAVLSDALVYVDPPASGPPSTIARYWRIMVYATHGSAAVNCAELELRAAVGGPDITPTVGGSASASNTNGGFVPANAFDNNNATFWVTNSVSMPQWLRYDLGAGNESDVLEISWRNRADGFVTESPSMMALQYSLDNVTWTTKKIWEGIPAWTAGLTRVFPV